MGLRLAGSSRLWKTDTKLKTHITGCNVNVIILHLTVCFCPTVLARSWVTIPHKLPLTIDPLTQPICMKCLPRVSTMLETSDTWWVRYCPCPWTWCVESIVGAQRCEGSVEQGEEQASLNRWQLKDAFEEQVFVALCILGRGISVGKARAVKLFGLLGDLEAVCYDSVTHWKVREPSGRETRPWLPRALKASWRHRAATEELSRVVTRSHLYLQRSLL